LYDDVLYCTTRLVPKMNQNEPSKWLNVSCGMNRKNLMQCR
jgi:hypothetical protein